MQFIDLQAQYRAYRDEMDAAMGAVVESARFINGPQVRELEEKLAAYVGVGHAVGMSSGTDALLAVLMAWGIGPGDEVICPAFTFIATAEVVALAGAKPIFVDVEPRTLNLDPELLDAAITPRTRAVIPVSLYGQCADFPAINAVAERHGLPVLEDACQSFGAMQGGRRSCGLTTAAATSFFPAKPLGCYGDGGMCFTNDGALAERLRVIREHGQTARYRHAVVGLNARLDTLQAAVLLVKIAHFDDEVAARQRVARRYIEGLSGAVEMPPIREGDQSIYAQFTVRVSDRERVIQRLTEKGVPTAVHYPLPLHRQPVFTGLEGGAASDEVLPVASRAAREVLSLPMHPFLTEAEQDEVIAALKEAVREG
ncbi:MAG: DegT/DnrJ/EryC1/StrS family aminotransferase [Magnetococcales bacterium]|nr:DegT/DnrJ/EryC1/StrS family aminotransferase [Magnetococcales bacterium]